LSRYHDKICLVCGHSFVPKTKNQKLCGSKECKHIWKTSYDKGRYTATSKQIEKTCVVCGKTFTTTDTRRKYCSVGGCLSIKPGVRFRVKLIIRSF
jgi:predicted nucleic acid-binding Zn ribbon protein